jgi:uncharacterized membrane protein
MPDFIFFMHDDARKCFNLYIRYQQGSAAIIPNGLSLSLVAVLLLLFSGWKGGDLVFRGHIGVAD